MSTFLTQFKYYLASYWHFVFIILVAVFALKETETPQNVFATVSCEKTPLASLSISKSAFDHHNYKQLSSIAFETPLNLTDKTPFQHSHLSAWYKIRFDKTLENTTIDFYQYETVIGFDEFGQNFNAQIAESGNNTPQHRRHIFFDFPKCDTPCTLYFKVFARTWVASDSLQLRFHESTTFHNRIYQEFYDNQSTAFWLLFVFGVGLFQLLYIGSLAWSRRKPEYVYYWLFVFVGVLYIYIARRFELGNMGNWQNWTTSSVVVYLAIINLFYCRFVRYYLDSKISDVFLDKQYRLAEWYFMVGTVVNLIIYALTLDLEYTFSFFVPFTNSVIVLDLYLLFLLFRQKTPLVKYLMMGAAIIVLMMGMRLLYDYLSHIGWINGMKDFDAYGSVFGSFIDAICLNLGLNYKHRLDILEKQKAVETMRNTIASDLHDDLGAGLSTIRLLGERAQIGLETPQKKQLIQKMTNEASQLIEKMSTVIWAINSRHDTLESLIAYLRVYALEYFEPYDLECQFKLPDLPPSVSTTLITGHTRKNLFLSFKEALHNIIKHAEATQVDISIQLETHILEIKITDNGKGINGEKLFGNGLKNMKERMESIGGCFSVFSEKNKGTTIVLGIIINKS